MEYQKLSAISVALKKARQQLGLTQEQAAERAGISYSYYVKIENALQTPSLDTMIQICEAFHLSMDRLFLSWPRTDSQLPAQIQIDARQLESCIELLNRLLSLTNRMEQ